jgi:hypothetical protein
MKLSNGFERHDVVRTKKVGRRLEDGLYRGTFCRGGHAAGCGCALGENGEEIHIQPITGT